MTSRFAGWARWTVRLAAWMTWQGMVLVVLLVLYANLFGEYGIIHGPAAAALAAVAFLAAALYAGTWPARRCFTRTRKQRSNRLSLENDS